VTLEQSELGFGIFLLMVILISRWFRIFNTMVRRLFYGWFISNSRTHTNSLRNVDTRPLLTMPEKTKFLNAAADNDYYLFLEHDAQRNCYNILKRNTIEGGLQSGRNLKIVLIVFIVQQNGLF
jgi:hypothetical protein